MPRATLTECLEVFTERVAPVEELALEGSGHLVVHVVKTIHTGNLSCVCQLEELGLETLGKTR